MSMHNLITYLLFPSLSLLLLASFLLCSLIFVLHVFLNCFVFTSFAIQVTTKICKATMWWTTKTNAQKGGTKCTSTCLKKILTKPNGKPPKGNGWGCRIKKVTTTYVNSVLMLHVGCTRCVTSITDHTMNIKAWIRVFHWSEPVFWYLYCVFEYNDT